MRRKEYIERGCSGYLIETFVEDIDSVQMDVHLKTDQEPAMLAFQARIHQARKSCRIRLAVESHLGVRLPRKHPVLMWIIEWVGGAHNRFKDGRDDGKTPRERAGWQTQSFVMEFGEVQFIPFRVELMADRFGAKL